MMNLLQSILVGAGSVAGALVTGLYVFQEKLLYHPGVPTKEYEKKPNDYSMNYSDAEIVAADGVKIHAWLITQPAAQQAATFLYFHGNAGNLSHRLPDVRQFYANGYNVMMVSYRGYGASGGQPSERGIRMDAAAAIAYVRDRSDVLDTSRIYLFGRSIGGACAIAATAALDTQEALRGIVVENTFTSINDMIDHIMPALSFVKPLNRNKWDSVNTIRQIRIPMLFISGLNDELCPPEHTRTLVGAAEKAKFTSLHTVAEGTHNDTWYRGGGAYREAINSFVRRAESEG